MKTDQNEGITEYPEIRGKTLKNATETENSLFFEFTDGSSFMASVKPLPDTKYNKSDTVLGNLNDFTIRSAQIVQAGYYNDMTNPENDVKLVQAYFKLRSTEMDLFAWHITAKSPVAQTIQLDTKLIPASEN